MRPIVLFIQLVGTILFFAISPSIGSCQQVATSSLEALLIVGPQEDGTSEAMKRMDDIAKLLNEHSIVSHSFYDKQAQWSDIKKIAPKCSFLIYAGHGATLGENGNAGGFCIQSYITTETVQSELRLKENAMVLFISVCGGAGSSAGDNGDIGIAEAKNRVLHYAYPFFEIGASAYYANNYVAGCYDFLEDFLSGIPLKKAYETSTEIWTSIEFEEPFEKDRTKLFSIASRPGGGYSTRTTYTNGVKTVAKIKASKSYSIAYVGAPDFNFLKLAGRQ